MVNFLKLKLKIWTFQAQFDLEDQGQGHTFLYLSETFMWSIHGLSLKVKFKTIQKLCMFTRNHTRWLGVDIINC